MSFSITETNLSSFNDTKLPRFQRKQTWKAQDNFKLAISVFKEYPIGVTIINEVVKTGEKYLLDGRQRRNALKLMYEDPVEVYSWASQFLKLKASDSENDVRNKFHETISIYLQNEFEKSTNDETDIEELDYDECIQESSFDTETQNSNLKTLLELILLVHGKVGRYSTFEAMFRFNGLVEETELQLEYLPIVNGEYKLDSKKLKKFITNIIEENRNNKEAFADYIVKRFRVKEENQKKLYDFIDSRWESYYEKCFKVIKKSNDIISNAKIGLIRLNNASALDAQNVFSLVNGGGSSLTAEELLSARPFWNVKIKNPSYNVQVEAQKLYNALELEVPDNIVRWDMCATLLSRIDPQHLVFEELNLNQKTDLTKRLTLGFKLISAIYIKGISSKAVTELEKSNNINWEIDIEKIIKDFDTIFSLIYDCNYFKCMQMWKKSVMSLTSNTIALEFATLLYFKWKKYEEPTKSNTTAVKLLQRDAIVLFDKLVYEYSNRLWAGSSDSRLSNDIKKMDDRFIITDDDLWTDLLERYSKGEQTNSEKAILYHYYFIKMVQPTNRMNVDYEIDHIYSQDQCKRSSIVTSKQVDSLGNKCILPKKDNTSKGNKTLNEVKIDDEWLFDEILRMTEIDEKDTDKYSDVINIDELIKERTQKMKHVFTEERKKLIANL